MSWRGVFAAAAAVLLWGAAPGCVPSSGSYCRKVCECTGCDDASEASCVDDVSDAQRRASDKKCGDQFNTYFACLDGQTRCVDGAIDDDGCETEQASLNACAGDIGIGASCVTLCEKIATDCGQGGGDCQQSCDTTEKLVAASGCSSPYHKFIACFSKLQNICQSTADCNDSAVEYTQCISAFCNNNPGTPGC